MQNAGLEASSHSEFSQYTFSKELALGYPAHITFYA